MPHRWTAVVLLLRVAWLRTAFGTVDSGQCEGARRRPNFVVILTDDQDVLLGSSDHMPTLKKELGDGGARFANAFANTPVCCPSRASILTGRLVHNHLALNNSIAGNCSSRAWQDGPERLALPVHLQAVGYQLAYAGKYLNQYGKPGVGGVRHVPPGWTSWLGQVGNSRYYGYTVSRNGKKEKHGKDYKRDYFTDVITRHTLRFLQEQTADTPFLAFLSPPAPHGPFTPAPQHNGTFKGWRSPRLPSWNRTGEASADKHGLLRRQVPMTEAVAYQSDYLYARRLETLLSVDDMLREVMDHLRATGLLNNTYVFYTSDHGYHLGEFGMPFDKRQLYEPDVRVPFFVRGPRIAAGTVFHEPVLLVDLAPTIVDLATGRVPDIMDGRSLRQMLFRQVPDSGAGNDTVKAAGQHIAQCPAGLAEDSGATHPDARSDPESAATAAPTTSRAAPSEPHWRDSFLIEYYGQGARGSPEGSCGGGGIGWVQPTKCDDWNNTYSCVRTITGAGTEKGGGTGDGAGGGGDGGSASESSTVFCMFTCFDDSHREVECPAHLPEGTGEYYDLVKDPYQLTNAVMDLSAGERARTLEKLDELVKCQGQTSCNLQFAQGAERV